MTDQREALARSTADHHVHSTAPKMCGLSNCRTRQVHCRCGQDCALRKIVFVHSGVHWIDFHRRRNIEASVLKAKTKSTGTRKQVYACWPHHPPPNRYKPQHAPKRRLEQEQIVNYDSRNACSLFPKLVASRASHCQTKSTRHPKRRRAVRCAASLDRFAEIFGAQYSSRVLGSLPQRQR